MTAPAAAVWTPLASTALCLDCEVTFGIGRQACPGCGSRQVTSLQRLLDGPPKPKGRADA